MTTQSEPVDASAPTITKTLEHRRSRRRLVVLVSSLVLTIALAVTALGLGDVTFSPAQVIAGLFKRSDNLSNILVGWRLSRVVAALVLGAAFALGGALIQSVAQNALASPDIIGFGAGSYTGALLVFLGSASLGTAITVADPVRVAMGSLAGGLVAGVIVFGIMLLCRLNPARLILVGIGVSAMLTAVNTFLITRADMDAARSAAVWSTGTLAGAGWPHIAIISLVLLLATAPLALLSPALKQLELGTDAARSLGIRVVAVQISAAILGILLTAAATAVAGPIGFVALAAPHIARRLAKTSFVPLGVSAAMGALLLLLSDVLAQHAVPGQSLPTGVVTVLIGGGYLVIILVRANRRGRQQ